MQSSHSLWRTVPRLLYIHNPFYLISALLVLVGLHQAFGEERSLAGGWLLMGLLCGYTSLLAVVGYIIVRFGRVWDDARMLLLIILLFFVALSVSFDKVLLDRPLHGAMFLLLGLWFSFVISEVIFASLRIRLPARYRLPYYLVLTFLFAYPLVLARLSFDGHDTAMSLGVLVFPMVAALVTLTLWPATRATGEALRPNGTPWPWPWFPWSIFGFLLIVVCLRSYSLSMAFESAKGSAVGFQPFFLSPLLIAVALLLLEMGLANKNPAAQRWAMRLPIVAVLFSLPGTPTNPVAGRLLSLLSSTAGSPAQLTLAAVGAFYLLAWIRKVAAGEMGVVICLAFASWVDSETLSLATFTEFQPVPMALVALIELPLGIWRRTSWRMIVGSFAALIAVTGEGWSTSMSLQSTYVLVHASLLLLLVLMALYDDRLSRALRRWAAPTMTIAAFVAATAYEFIFPGIPAGYHATWLLGLCIVAWLYWRRAPGFPEFLAMLACIGALLGFSGKTAYLALRWSPLGRGLPTLAGGVAALALAFLVSLIKGGLLIKGWQKLRKIAKT